MCIAVLGSLAFNSHVSAQTWGGSGGQKTVLTAFQVCSVAEDYIGCQTRLNGLNNETVILGFRGGLSVCVIATLEERETLLTCDPYWKGEPFLWCETADCFLNPFFRMKYNPFKEAPIDTETWPVNDPVVFAGFEDLYCTANDTDVMSDEDYTVKYDQPLPRQNFPTYVYVTPERIFIRPRSRSVPEFNIPNTVGADGWSASNFNEHVYNVYTDVSAHNLSPQEVGAALRANPTPGNSKVATPDGAANDVGPIGVFPVRRSVNLVKSFAYSSPDPSMYTDMVINYTIKGAHLAHEGYVVRFGVISNGKVIGIRSYGEGEAREQSPPLRPLWCDDVSDTWQENAQEIIEELLR